MKSEKTILENSLRQSILLAFERLGTEPYNVENTINDILSEFKRLNEDDISLAFRNGALGKYGKTYRLCTQDFCLWIREFYKSRNANML